MDQSLYYSHDYSVKAVKQPFLQHALRIARKFFVGEKMFYAITMLALVVSLELGYVYLTLKFNYWYNGFYNSLQDYDYHAFLKSLLDWAKLVAMLIIVFLGKYFLNTFLQLKWRVWMTDHFLKLWTDNNAFYGVKILSKETDNPDQRISEDIRSFIGSFMSLSIGMISNIFTLILFFSILWQLSGILHFYVEGYVIIVKGYLVWAALVYTAICTLITHLIGRSLSSLLFHQERVEADFRYSLVRLRENAESIAMFHAVDFEKKSFTEKFSAIVQNTIEIIKRRIKISFFLNFYANLAIIFPFIAIAPRYFRREIKFGDVMQTMAAFDKVQSAMAWFIDAYVEIASFKAVTLRLNGFLNSLDDWQNSSKIHHHVEIEEVAEGYIGWNHLRVYLPNDQLLYTSEEIKLEFGNNYIIKGKSGVGKSTLVRTIAGLWPFAEGEIFFPKNLKTMFVPQKSYMPNSTLLNVLRYPATFNINEQFLSNLLDDFGLKHLNLQLDEVQEWGRILSGGEQQKVAFIRVILQQADIVFLDEATNAMDASSEEAAYNNLRKYLPNIMIISIGHNAAIDKYHNKQIVIAQQCIKVYS